MDCVYVITLEAGYYIKLNIKSFYLDTAISGECQNFVEVTGPRLRLVVLDGAHIPSIAFRHLPQTLPDLVTPLKGHSLFLYLRAAVQRRGQRPPKGSGTNMTVEAT